MVLGTSQQMSQSLVMTPALQQAIKLLQLSRIELEEQIQAELQENPVLELVEEAGSAPQSVEEGQSQPDEVPVPVSEAQAEQQAEQQDFENYLNKYEPESYEPGMFDLGEEYEAPIRQRGSLVQLLLGQIGELCISPEEQVAAEMLVQNLDDDGYLRTPLAELANEDFSETFLEEVLVDIVQDLDPLGIGSRTLGEFLLVQINNMKRSELTVPYPLVKGIIDRYLGELDKKGIKKIARILRYSEEQVLQAILFLKELEPSPAGGDEPEYNPTVIPDIYYVKNQKGKFEVILNDDGIPRLGINQEYVKLAKNGNRDTYNYVEKKYQAAKWFVRSIEQRQRTIFRVGESILKFQRKFFEYGVSHLQGLNLRDVADDIGVHESTVSRVTSNKYAHTPFGIYELKFFFGSGIKGGSLSVEVLKARFKELIDGEDPKKPLTDDDLVEKLRAEGYEIARRTATKYRADMNIPTASARKNRL